MVIRASLPPHQLVVSHRYDQPDGISLRLLTSILFAVIIVVLRACDGKALPELPFHITLNSFIAFFTSLTKAAFMNPVAECISQLKWNWFEQERPLSDFETFDKASRGVLGSVFLLNLLKWR